MSATPNKQRGATLVVTLVLVALLSILAIYGVGISVMDQRSSANEYRAEEAGLAADAGIDQAIAYLKANRTAVSGWSWDNCAAGDTTVPCGTVPSADRENWKKIEVPAGELTLPYASGIRLFLLTPNSGAQEEFLFNIVAEGKSADGASTNVSKQGAYFYPVVIGEVDAPMMAAGGVSFNGNYNVVVNPNGAGTGVPLSAWSGSDITIGTGSPATCQLSEFLSTGSSYTTQTDNSGNTLTMCASCTCPASATLSSNGNEGVDILDVDGNVGANADTTTFPSDMFQYLFGVPTADYIQVKQMATVIADCSGLDTTSAGLYWVTGNCTIPGNVGSFANPVLLIVEGDISMNANNYVMGVMFAFSTNPAATLSVTLNGGPTLYGGVMTNANISLPVGTFKMRYDVNVITNLKNNLSGRGLAKVPGSWADF